MKKLFFDVLYLDELLVALETFPDCVIEIGTFYNYPREPEYTNPRSIKEERPATNR